MQEQENTNNLTFITNATTTLTKHYNILTRNMREKGNCYTRLWLVNVIHCVVGMSTWSTDEMTVAWEAVSQISGTTA